MTSRVHPGTLILDAHHLSSALSSSSFMAAVSWRASRVLVPSLVHIGPPRTARHSFHPSTACGELPGGFCRRPALAPPTSAPAPFRLTACVPARSSSSSYSFHGFASCRAAADQDGDAVEQEGDFEGLSSVAPKNGEYLESSSREGNDFVRDNVGGLHVITGPMFAGKTTALLKRIQKEADAGRYFGMHL